MQSDIDEFAAHEKLLPKEVSKEDCTFIDSVHARLKQRIKESTEIVQSVLAQKFDFTVDEKIETDRNLKTDLTNSHKLGIENENECIRYGFYLQKNYSSDKDLKPATSVYFGVTLLPFGENYKIGY